MGLKRIDDTYKVLKFSKSVLLSKPNGVRRSKRLALPSPETRRRELIKQRLNANNDADSSLEVRITATKGRGVFAVKPFEPGDFIVEYAGELLSSQEAEAREVAYANDPSKGCYSFFFQAGGQKWCVDATAESGRIGRLVNHSRKRPNARPEVFYLDDQPRLILVACRLIKPNDEINYDYGDSSFESRQAYPWLLL